MKKAGLSLVLSSVSGAFVAVLYVVFGLADLWFSLIAFRFGVPEGNPFLALMGEHGLFVPAKLALTGVAALLISRLYYRPRVQMLCWSALLAMMAVDAYHVVNLNARL